ncbi:MAG: hypothetical protein M0Q92_06660 [Methanoregula sp.]|jgi:hypothetical protein|nr:hypothetical protein [Methanoregula sp.]
MKWPVPGTILLLCILVTGSLAADITFTAGQQDYYFLTGQAVEIPITVTSTYPDETHGIVRFSTDVQLQKTGVVMISTQNRVFSHTVPVGHSFLNLTMAPSQVARDYKVHISFWHAAPSPVNASLPEIYIHIVADPSLMKNIPVPRESTSLQESGEIPSESSVSIVEQTVSTWQQMGSDSTGQQSVAGNQPQGDTETAREQQLRDKERWEQEQREFYGRLFADPLVAAVNASLVSEGFTRQALDTQPAGKDTGTFSMLYRKGADDQVVVQGAMHAGIIPSISESSNADIATDPSLGANTTFLYFSRTLRDHGYSHSGTAINRTLTGAIVNITYVTPEGQRAFVNATIEDNHVIQLAMEEEAGPGGFLWVPITILVMAILTVFGWYVYTKYKRHKIPPMKTSAGQSCLDFDHRDEARQLILDAERASEQHRYTDAYGLASRSLRVFLSHEYGDHEEVTTAEIVSALRSSGRNTADLETILQRCDEIVFARQMPDAAEISTMIRRIREIITA